MKYLKWIAILLVTCGTAVEEVVKSRLSISSTLDEL